MIYKLFWTNLNDKTSKKLINWSDMTREKEKEV